MNLKEEKYELIFRQISSLVERETEEVSVLANVAAVVHESMGFWWTGFYLVKGGELRLGPFQGPVACMHIGMGKGVCGTCWKEGKTLIVDDVETFPGHIACSSLSRSEIVVPIYNKVGTIVGVLDIDSKEVANFDETDREWLEKIVDFISQQLYDE